MTRATSLFRWVSLSGLMLFSLFMLAPQARADIVEVEAATSCPGSLGGGLCNGSVPFELSALLTSLSAPNSIGSGSQKYVVTDDIGNGFSFTLTSTGQNSTGVANNGSCQINGGAKSFFSACTIKDSLNQTTSLGGPQINNLTFPITITFSGSAGLGSTFDLGFVSMQGSSNVVSVVPEPTSLTLFCAGLIMLGLVTLVRARPSRA